jgi:transglutaminase-like putative cysteine protease
VSRVLGFIAVSAALLASAPSTWAATLTPAFAAPPAWVDVAPVPEAPPVEDAAAVQPLLDDNQSRLGPDGDAYYNRRIMKILKPEGLAGLTSFGQSWKPDTETVTFHGMRIIRGDKTIDLLADGKKMLVLRRETDLERAALDGRMTASQQLEGLQAGDILDYSYTVTRQDPITQGRSYDAEGLAFAGVATRYRAQVSWPDGTPARWRATEGFGPPTVSQHDGRTWLDYEAANVSAPKAPVGAPLRYRRLGTLEVSSFQTWQEISGLMAPHYAKAMELAKDSPIKAEAKAIAAATKDPKARAFAALRLVEDKTRYFFIGLGEGGYVPATADETWERRFGDCKGKTVLLLALLKELKIPAEPALVSLGGGDGLDERLPSLGAFNHVIVRATIAGKVYWLDGTRTGDRSGLDSLRPPPHHWALPVRAAGSDLEQIALPPLTVPSAETVVRFDASKGLDQPAAMTMTTRVTGEAANALRQMLARAPRPDVERNFRQSMSRTMSWVEVQTIDWKDDADHDAFEIDIAGKADMDWRKNADLGVREFKVVASSTAAGGFPRREPGPNRDAPFAVPYPVFARSTSEIVLPDEGKGFTVRGPNGLETVGGVELNRSSAIAGGVARFVTETRSLVPEISAAEAEAATRTLRRLAADDSLVRAPL